MQPHCLSWPVNKVSGKCESQSINLTYNSMDVIDSKFLVFDVTSLIILLCTNYKQGTRHAFRL